MTESLQAFREWAITQGGNIGNPLVNTYRGQCVSLVQQYLYRVFAIPYAPRGNAKDFVPPNFSKVSGSPRAGDVVRWPASNYSKYGHIGLIDDDALYLYQNKNGDGKIHRGEPIPAGYTLFRPSGSFAVKNSSATYYTIKKGDTFWALENAWRLSHGTLQKLNPAVVATRLQVGQKIRRS